MKHPILVLTHNNYKLTRRCIDSLERQDVPVEIWIGDNGSSDETVDYILSSGHRWFMFDENTGVSNGWNYGLKRIFKKNDHCLVIGNDTVLPRWMYSCLLSSAVPFVTGVAVDDMSQCSEFPKMLELTPNPDFSCFLMHREIWEKVGQFDESMVNYCGDCDMHVRAHRLGISLYKASIPFYHERSSTIGLAPDQEKAELHAQANLDREAFKKKYGCIPGDDKYDSLFP